MDVDESMPSSWWLRTLMRFEPWDHFVASDSDTFRGRVEDQLVADGVRVPVGRITALLNIRRLGLGSDPLNLFWCHDPSGSLACVVAEIHSRRNGRHCYTLRSDEIDVITRAGDTFAVSVACGDPASRCSPRPSAANGCGRSHDCSTCSDVDGVTLVVDTVALSGGNVQARLSLDERTEPMTGVGGHTDTLGELLGRVARQDPTAFAELYDATRSRVFGMVLRVLRDPGYSEETTQEVYLQVWRSADKYDPRQGSALSWIITLAHRRAVDRVRSEQSGADRESQYGSTNVDAAFDSVSEEVAQRDDRRRVNECLGSLTELQRRSVELAYYRGFTYTEVAEELSSPLPTVKSRIRDGLKRLKNCLGVSVDG